MPPRLSTAQILAAARAADGKRSAATAPAALMEPANLPERLETSAPETATEATGTEAATAGEPATTFTESTHQPATTSPAASDSALPVPPAVASMLRRLRQERSGSVNGDNTLPPSMQTVLQSVRDRGVPLAARPASMQAILQRVRELCGTANVAPAARKASAAATPAASSARTTSPPGTRLSTAEILAAARGQGKPAVTANDSGSVPKPVASSGNRTADILAAARRQGGVSGNREPSAGAAPAPKRTPAGTVKTKTAAAGPAAASGPADDGAPRPPAMGKLLAAVRTSARRQQESIQYPPLATMLGELRAADRRVSHRTASSQSRAGWFTKVRQWFSPIRETHQGASI